MVLAHEETVGQVAGNYRIEFLSERDVSTGVDVTLQFRIEDASTNQTLSGLNSYVIFDPNIRVDLQERDGIYYGTYNFKKPAIYEVHDFFINGERLSVDFHITATGGNYETTGLLNYIFYAIPVLGLIGALYFGRNRKLKVAAEVFILSLIITGLAYSVSVYYSSGAATEGIVVCNPNNSTDCTWQAHIHTLIIPQLCDEEARFEIEVGLLNQTHTHEERNVLHWHDRLPYDSVTQEILDTSPLRLDNSLRSIGFSIINSTDCIGTTKYFANKENYWTKDKSWTLEDRTYVWSDRDIIYIAHGNRTVEEVLLFLGTTQFSFPTLGPA